MPNTEGSKTHKRLLITPIIKRLSVKKGENTEGVKFKPVHKKAINYL
ncbi:MAG: hypothetical protein U5L45_13180 [Saprospiraceae bacterium]|nr:hypothetical protein [Saprospiraceae bacterium]